MNDLVIYAISVAVLGLLGWALNFHVWKGGVDVRVQVLEQFKNTVLDSILSGIRELRAEMKDSTDEGKHAHEKMQERMDKFHREDSESRRAIYDRLGRLEQEIAEIHGRLRPYKKGGK